MTLNKPYTNAQYANLAHYCNTNGMNIEDKGDYLESVPVIIVPPLVTEESQRLLRSRAYQSEVDPITSHIQRLRDTDPTSSEIDLLLTERNSKVEEIKLRYPYPVIDPSE